MKTGFFRDVAVLPIEETGRGNVPWAFCLPHEPVSFKKGKVLRVLRTILPTNHLPQRFILVDKIPRTGSGKVDKTALKQMAASE